MACLTITWLPRGGHFWRNRVFSFINVLGLAIGIAVFLLIFEYVLAEWNANRFISQYERLYRVNTIHREGMADEAMQPGFAPLFQRQVGRVEAYVRLTQGIESGIVSAEREGENSQPVSFRENKMTYVDGNFFSLFSYTIIEGIPSLQQPKTLALSQSAAAKYFGNIDPLGKTMIIDNQFGKTIYTVTAVYEDMPQESDLQSDFAAFFVHLIKPRQPQ